MSLLVVVDIDGTIADASRRFKEAGPEPLKHNKEQYEAWLRDVQNTDSLLADPVVTGMSTFLVALGAIGLVDIIYLTSRENKWRGVTEQWLIKNKFPMHFLYMRPDGSYEESDDFKERLIKQNLYTLKADEVIVLDDDQQGRIEAMCAKNGWTFLKACSGGKE